MSTGHGEDSVPHYTSASTAYLIVRKTRKSGFKAHKAVVSDIASRVRCKMPQCLSVRLQNQFSESVPMLIPTSDHTPPLTSDTEPCCRFCFTLDTETRSVFIKVVRGIILMMIK